LGLLLLCGIWVVSEQVLRCEAQEDTGAAYVDTVREGLAYRASVIRTMTGTAEMEFTFSPATCERGRNEADAYAKQMKWIGEVLPLDPTHGSHLTFSADFGRGQWSCDVTDLTVSGHYLWASSNDPPLNRHLPPDTFRRVAVSDGTKTYVYDHSLQRGWIDHYTGEPCQMPQPVAHVYDMTCGAPSSVLTALDDSRYAAVFLGEEEVEGSNCLKIRLSPNDLSLGGSVVTLWSAPALDFALVRQESRSYVPASSPDEVPVLDRIRITVAAEFVKMSDTLWCPMTAETICYRGGPGGAESWDYTRVIRIECAEVNVPLAVIVTPYEFPAGTKVTDLTQGTVSVAGEGED